MPSRTLSPEALSRALALRDLTDPAQGPHALQRVVSAAVEALASAWRCPVLLERASPIVSVADNYDRLRYPEGGAARDARYTRYVSETHLLRTQTSAMIPPMLRRLAGASRGRRLAAGSGPPDVLLACPGLVYRRDAIDRLHTGEPHQLDLWRIRSGPPLDVRDLEDMIARVTAAVAPGRAVRTTPATHPYTLHGRQLDVDAGGRWIEIGECGLAHPGILSDAGLPPGTSGLALGLGLDRLLMLAKGMDDIRLLRSPDPRVASQLLDLAPWRPVSRQPALRRDLSVAVAADADADTLGDDVREALGPEAAAVEAVAVVSETPGPALPAAARERLGLVPGQKNVLLRLTLRAADRTLTDAEANRLRDRVYAAVHRGTRQAWACGEAPSRGALDRRG